MNTRRFSFGKQRGVSMVEVLIAVLVFSLGMMGLGGLLIFATQANHVAYLRTQVGFLARAMADRMSANPIAVWDGSYNVTYPVTGTVDCRGSTGAGCAPDDMAAYDAQMWTTQLQTFLPNSSLAGNIVCTADAGGFVPQPAQLPGRPPYGGTCKMTITWIEHGTNTTAKNGKDITQTFAWVFQP